MARQSLGTRGITAQQLKEIAMKAIGQMGPILRALMKSRLSAALVVLQVALTLAIVANMLPVVYERVVAALRPSGVTDQQLFAVSALTTADEATAMKQDLAARTARERQVIMAIDGVESASFGNTFTNSNSGWSSSVRTKVKDGTSVNSAFYMADEHAMRTLGLQLIAGRNFDPREIVSVGADTDINPRHVIITDALAKLLFPNEAALGKRVSLSSGSQSLDSEIIGVVKDVGRPWISGENYYVSSYLPYRLPGFAMWIVRGKPGVDLQQLSQQVQAALAKADRSMIYGTRALLFTDARREAYADSMLVAGLLASFSVLVLTVTALGIVGLASFWITQRSRQIGICRALGARARDIVSYFRQENLLLTGTGCALGILLAYALNFALTKQMDAEQLSWRWVGATGMFLLLLGQFAITAPAKRAAKIAPALATRS
jgi:putative ABC transport system permease protein